MSFTEKALPRPTHHTTDDSCSLGRRLRRAQHVGLTSGREPDGWIGQLVGEVGKGPGFGCRPVAILLRSVCRQRKCRIVRLARVSGKAGIHQQIVDYLLNPGDASDHARLNVDRVVFQS